MVTKQSVKKVKFSQRMLRTCAKTIRDYDKLIADQNFLDWNGYGAHCNLCAACPGGEIYDCNRCPLHDNKHYVYRTIRARLRRWPRRRGTCDHKPPCTTVTSFGNLIKAFRAWKSDSYRYHSVELGKNIIKAAKRRRAFLIKRFDRNAPEWRGYYKVALTANAKKRCQ